MKWIDELSATQPVAYAVLLLALVAVAGLSLGGWRVRGIGLGSTGVLFAGIFFGHFGFTIDHSMLEFVREFGLILFVYTIGMQLGPGFLASLRREGVPLNLMATAIVLLGGFITALAAWLLRIDFFAAPGIFSGATTNTPSLGAAQQTLLGLGQTTGGRATLLSLAYAVSYPVGVAGIIATLLLLRAIFRIDLACEAEAFAAERKKGVEPLERLNLVIENRNLDGLSAQEIPARDEMGVSISRICRQGESEVHTVTGDTLVHVGDTILAVGARGHLERFRRIVGRAAGLDLMKAPGQVAFGRFIVTRKEVLGKTLKELGLDHFYGVSVTRIMRADVEMTAVDDLRLQFGDWLQIVGEQDSLDKVADLLGNSLQALNQTHFVPVFLGIALGVAAGCVPMQFPGLPVAVRLGLAGGPLVAAIILSRIGRIGGLLWYMPVNANLAIRELGITLFLACVGLKAGAQFFHTVFSQSGLLWLAAAALVTVLPLLIVGCVARGVFKLNYMTISGLIAGSMTDPPALAFANAMSQSDAPAVSYATVYPLTMLLRIIAAQILVLLLCR
jgi:putative transport protein